MSVYRQDWGKHVKDELRPYPAYKPSGVEWLGDVPEHWDVKPGFAAYRAKQARNTGMAETTVLSLSYGRIVIKPPEKLHGLVPASFETYQIVEPGDIIIRPTDLQNDWTSLRVGLSRHRGIITSAYLCLATDGVLKTEYGYYLLHAYDLMKIFYGMGAGLRQNLDFSDLKRMPILVPPPDEQAAIVRFLDHMDARIRRYIQAKRRLITLLTEQKQALIHQAVTQGLDPSAPRKPSGVEWLGDIPAHWEVWQIKYLAKVGNGSTPSRSVSGYWTDSGFPWLNSSSVNQGEIAEAYQFVTPLALRECHLPIVPAQSVLVAITGQGKTRGTAGLLTFEATINQHIAYITPAADKLSSPFLHLFLIGAYQQLRAISDDSGSTKGALTCEDVKSFRVVLPPRCEQEAIVEHVQKSLAKVDGAIVAASREIDLIREYRTRLIADVVTGQLDVRGVAATLPATPDLTGVGKEMLPMDMDEEASDEDDPTDPEDEG